MTRRVTHETSVGYIVRENESLRAQLAAERDRTPEDILGLTETLQRKYVLRTEHERQLSEAQATIAAQGGLLGEIQSRLTLPEVDRKSVETGDSPECPSCGTTVDWRGDGPDVGDCVICDTCAQALIGELSVLVMPSDALKASSARQQERVEEAVKQAKDAYFQGWPEGIEKRELHKRIGDMHPTDCIRVMADVSGDACLALVTEERGMQTIEFCTPGAGGGRSPRTRVAILRLAQAIKLDEEADRIRKGQG